MNHPSVRASPEAVAFIVEHAGRVFVWANNAGMRHVKLHPPAEPVEFKQLPCDGFEFNVATDIADPVFWKVVLRHLPHRHVDALFDGDQPYLAGPMGTDGRIRAALLRLAEQVAASQLRVASDELVEVRRRRSLSGC